ncbi:TPA: two-component system sensor histidine kinase BaeS, partial [Pluralibacter gergoviae]
MKLWRPNITAKLFLAIFATCILLLITMHWAVRLSFEHGFIDYIKRGNEQRLQLLSEALSEQYESHGSWRFLRGNDRFIFQILRTLEHDTPDDGKGPPQMPPHGWRTQFWVVDQNA